MTELAIVGMGLLTGAQTGRSMRSILAEASRVAIEDAGVARDEVTAAVEVRSAAGRGGRVGSSDAFCRLLGLPVDFYQPIGRGGTGGAFALAIASALIDRGIANYVVIAGGSLDYSESRQAKAATGAKGTVRIEPEGYWGRPFGDLRAVSHHSLFASRHMHEFGTTSRHLGLIATQLREWAQLNPQARYYGRPLTLEQYEAEDYLVYPYRRDDVCVMTDGAVAMVVTGADRARDAQHPVWVRGLGFGEAMAQLWWDKGNYTSLAVRNAKEQAFGQAGITLSDIDCAQFYDCFTGEVLLQLEDYGWAGKGEGGAFLESTRIGPGGTVAVNTSGGLMSAYHFGDLTGFSEALLQLRGRAGARQLPDCRTALVTGHGGEVLNPGMCSAHSTVVLGTD
ncbi:thiolase [Rugosimonospora acidiphila]|uniref:Thiolase n=1 Tax=Rugosimonospora acidiphila TaxID=556531 RepID=A0ABP9SQ72_9ACTN